MASLNKVILIGNLGKDPELRYTGSGQAVVNFSLATSERWQGKEGDQQERTEWHRIVVWGPQGEMCSKYLKKGRQIYLEGRLQTRQWEDKDGQTRYTTEINASRVLFLGGRGEGEGGESWGSQVPPEPSSVGGGGGGGNRGGGGGYNDNFSDDDIPF